MVGMLQINSVFVSRRLWVTLPFLFYWLLSRHYRSCYR